MTELEFKIQLLLENLNVKCRYYSGDEEVCEKFGYLPDGASFCTCNCDGEIMKCDLYRRAKSKNLFKDEL